MRDEHCVSGSPMQFFNIDSIKRSAIHLSKVRAQRLGCVGGFLHGSTHWVYRLVTKNVHMLMEKVVRRMKKIVHLIGKCGSPNG